ncbi:MAG: proline racemase family protein [Gemmatimonadota bacterium]|nr:proline racemase family protein [Gemmatimonadota bacterium]MDE3004588.1 proline racemase family protein [Gemmatimonadota bacterium]
MLDEWLRRVRSWAPPKTFTSVHTIDAHTEGEPLRVIFSGFSDLEGETVLERRRWARDQRDHVRRALMWEPRGHPDMYGCIVMPPVTPEADLSVLFTHNEGFSTMCGHGIIGVATVLVECGLLESGGEDVEIGIDTPAGFVRAHVEVAADGSVLRVRFENVPSFAERLDATVDVAGVGEVRYDLGFGGAYYAYVDAAELDVALVPGEGARLIDLGRRIKRAVQDVDPPEHPDDQDLSFVYGTIFVGPPHEEGNHSRNVCVFADGEVDRCPTGTGVSGRLAIHHARGEIGVGESVRIESILGTCFDTRILAEVAAGDRTSILPEVAGRAWITGRHEFLIASDDPLRDGFLVR